MASFGATQMFADQRLPLVMSPGSPACSLLQFARDNADVLKAAMLEHGGVLLRGFEIGSSAEFAQTGQVIAPEQLDYVYRSTPRTAVGAGVFTATEYPRTLSIPMHSENAYQRSWPRKLAFWCKVAATSGGETPIADLKRVTRALEPDLIERFAQRGVRYVRHYREELDLPWQVVFQTESRSEVERYCQANDIEFAWLEEDVLRTTQTCQGVATHPVTQERVFFNQAHLFHVSALPTEVAEMLQAEYGDTLPRHAVFGDGTEIPPEDLRRIRAAYKDNAVSFSWRAGDVLFLDNMQVAHGRNPYEGERELLALLLEPYAPSEP